MTEHTLEQAAQIVLAKIKSLAPYDTGNLALNAIRLERTAPNEYRIYVSVDGEHTPKSMDGIAPYMVYVNEKPTLGKGNKTNPNYQWWENAIETALAEGSKFLKGELKNAYTN